MYLGLVRRGGPHPRIEWQTAPSSGPPDRGRFPDTIRLALIGGALYPGIRAAIADAGLPPDGPAIARGLRRALASLVGIDPARMDEVADDIAFVNMEEARRGRRQRN
jgi:hypothetical protein